MMQICDRVTYLQFAKATGVASNRKDQIRVVQFFKSEYKVVVAVGSE